MHSLQLNIDAKQYILFNLYQYSIVMNAYVRLNIHNQIKKYLYLFINIQLQSMYL